MRVLQLIDSLNPGGAERMAVNIANALAGRVEGSFLCATRQEGGLRDTISPEIGYLFLRKRKTVDLSALLRLKRFVTENSIDIVHAHTTSYFLATQLKLVKPGLKLVWHEHHGARIHSKKKKNRVLVKVAKRFDHIITVNPDLNDWWSAYIDHSKISYYPNFVRNTQLSVVQQDRNKQVICLANLRHPKDHMNLVEAFKRVHAEYPEWELILIGKDLEDAYSKEVKSFIENNGLGQRVMLTGQLTDVEDRLQQGSIGVLSSSSEGLPMALLEYGMAGLAVVSTNVGNCAEVITNFGKVVPPADSEALANTISMYIADPESRARDAAAFRNHISEHYSEKAVLEGIIDIYSRLKS